MKVRNLFLMAALIIASAFTASAAQFNTRAAAVANVSTGYSATATSIVLNSGQGATQVPVTPCLAYWYNTTDYSFPMDDPFGEVIQCTALSTDTLTIVRGQCGTAASAKNLGGKSYNLAFASPGTRIATAIQQSDPHKTVGDSGIQSNNFGANGLTTDLIANSTAGKLPAVTMGGATAQAGTGTLSSVSNQQVSISGVGCTSAGTDDTLFTYTLPANALKNVGDSVRITAFGQTAGNTHNVVGKVFFGGTAYATTGTVSTTAAFPVCMKLLVTKTGASTQMVFNELITCGAGTSNIAPAKPTAAAITDTSAIIIKFTGNCTTASEILGNGLLVEYLGAGGGN